MSKVSLFQACFTGFVYIMLMQRESAHCWTFYQTLKLISTTDWHTRKIYFLFSVNHVAFKLHRLFTFLPPKHSVYPKALYCTRWNQTTLIGWEIDFSRSCCYWFNLIQVFFISNFSFHFRPRAVEVVCLSHAKSC